MPPSGDQFITALFSPGRKHLAAAGGFHSGAETVHFLSPPSVRLESSLGHEPAPYVLKIRHPFYQNRETLSIPAIPQPRDPVFPARRNRKGAPFRSPARRNRSPLPKNRNQIPKNGRRRSVFAVFTDGMPARNFALFFFLTSFVAIDRISKQSWNQGVFRRKQAFGTKQLKIKYGTKYHNITLITVFTTIIHRS